MQKLSQSDLMSLEQYAQERNQFREKVMSHKKNRQVHLGDNLTLYFEDRLTMQYQIQEMLRVERIFEAEGIKDELDAYNPLIPDGNNFKATMMIEYDDPAERKQRLAQLIGIERQVWVQVDGYDKVYPIANEDLERETEEKTSSVHFLRFELKPDMAAAARSGALINMGVDHQQYRVNVSPIADNVRQSLAKDLD